MVEKKIKALFLILIIACTFGCSKEKAPVSVEKKYSKSISIKSIGLIKEYKIINTNTKKEIIKVNDPEPKSITQVIDVFYATYTNKIEVLDQEKLTLQVPITENIKSFSIQIGSTNYSLPKKDSKLNVYYIDFEAPKQL